MPLSEHTSASKRSLDGSFLNHHLWMTEFSAGDIPPMTGDGITTIVLVVIVIVLIGLGKKPDPDEKALLLLEGHFLLLAHVVFLHLHPLQNCPCFNCQR